MVSRGLRQHEAKFKRQFGPVAATVHSCGSLIHVYLRD
jgi:hypothetical protein